MRRCASRPLVRYAAPQSTLRNRGVRGINNGFRLVQGCHRLSACGPNPAAGGRDTMSIRFHPHARERMAERGATIAEVVAAVEQASAFRRALVALDFAATFPLKAIGGARAMR